MGEHKHLDPVLVRREFIARGANVSTTADYFQVARETVYAALKKAPPLVVGKVSLTEVEGAAAGDQTAIGAYIRACLDRAGILKEQPGG